MPSYGGLVNNVTAPRFKVVVSNKHITEAIRRDSHKCMVEEATVDAYGTDGRRHAAYAQVDLQTIRFTDLNLGLRFWYLTPRSVQEAIVAFDSGKPVKPFSFTLSEAHVYRSGWKGQSNRTAESRKGPRVTPSGPRKVPMPRKERQFGLQMYTK